MIKKICDRCNKEIENNFYKIYIYQVEDLKGRLTCDGFENNFRQNTSNEEIYCQQCIEEIKEYIKEK